MDGLMKTIRASGLAFVLSVVPVGAVALPTFSNVWVFGDSLSDTGNVAIALTDFTQIPPATPTQCVPFSCEGAGADLVPGLPYATGNPFPPPFPRFSNGPLWIEGLASGLGLSAEPALNGGTNFAFGGARTGPPSTAPSLLEQFFGAFLFNTTGGFIPTDALYVVWGGGDDGRDIAKAMVDPDPSLRISESEADLLIGQAVTNVAAIVGTLAAAGADVLVPNLPDLGLTPEARDRDKPGDLPGLVDASSLVSRAFNDALDAVLDTLALVSPSANIIKLDIDALVEKVLLNPSAFGFADGVNPCISRFAECVNPEDFVFLDGIHPTAAGHAVIARAALAAVPEPAVVALLCFGLAGLAVAGRRRRNDPC